jgi:hypothetical protein
MHNLKNAFLRSSGFAVITISNTTYGKLPKVISPSLAVQFEACHCGDSYSLWNFVGNA